LASKTTLNEKNLQALGSERLSALLIEIVTGNAELKRQARAALLEHAGGDALPAEVRKRIATIKRSRSFIDWDKRRAFVKDLNQQRLLIVEKIGPSDPATALELMWRFMELAESVHNRADDSNGDIGDVFREGCEALGLLATAAKPNQEKLADQAFEALFEGNDYAQYDGLIGELAPTLGKSGLNRLKEKLITARDTLASKEPAPNAGRQIGWSSSGPIYESAFRHESQSRTVRYLLQEIADAQGDVDAFTAGYDEAARAQPRIAAAIANRLVEADRAEEALEALDKAEFQKARRRAAQSEMLLEWTDARIAALDALGRQDEVQGLRWNYFEISLSIQHLQDYLKALPDFEDVEAEERGLDYVRGFADIHMALCFFFEWPDRRRAADLVLAEEGKWDGNRWYILPDIAQDLAGEHPLAATVLLRASIFDTLGGAKSKRYKHAARHLLECDSLSHQIEDFQGLSTHQEFKTLLRDGHPRKTGFWSLLPNDDL
jgi:hypothetical protein